MRMGQAANYFNRTTFDGWNGTAWVSNVVTATLQGYDRSLMVDNLFDTKRRFLLAKPEMPVPSLYPVIRPHNEQGVQYMVGELQKDIEDTAYSLVYLLHQVTVTISTYETVLTTRASGVPSVMTPTLRASTFGDIEKISEMPKEELKGVTHVAFVVMLPRGTTVNRNYDLKINGTTYVINECYPSLGLIRCSVREKDVP